jgi:hypothetical protein
VWTAISFSFTMSLRRRVIVTRTKYLVNKASHGVGRKLFLKWSLEPQGRTQAWPRAHRRRALTPVYVS